MLQVRPAHVVPGPSSGGALLYPGYKANNASFDETNSIISLYGKLYAPSQVSETESVVISGSMPPGKVLAHLSRHGCEDLTSKLDLQSISNGVVSTGGSGDIYRGSLKDGRRVGIKCLRVLVGMDEEGEKQVKRAARELYIWSRCKHPNIQELTGMALHDQRVAMVSPWMKNGNLSWYISRNPGVDRYGLIVQTAAAVAYLRESGVVHGDIKALNFLVSEDHVVKLTDFGSSMVNHSSVKFTATTSSSNMTLRWTAPEIFLGETQHTYEGDVYALGMTILETITGSIPWGDLLDVAVMHNLIQKTHPSRPEARIPTGYRPGDRLWELMVRCWASEPGQRPHATEVRDKLMVINQQHQTASSIDLVTDRSSSDVHTPTKPTSSDVQTGEELPLPTPHENVRNRRFWKRSWGSSQTTSSVAESATRSVPNPQTSPLEKVDKKKQRKLELLEKRRLQEEKGRSRAKGVMVKRELMLVGGNFEPGDWTDPFKISAQWRATMRMPTHPNRQQPLDPSGAQEPHVAIGGQWRGPYEWDDATNNDQSSMSPDQRRLSVLTFATGGSDPGPRRRERDTSFYIYRGSSVSLQDTSSNAKPSRSARSLPSFEQFVSAFSTQARIDEDQGL
ncbi:tyrosine kinase catalytic domain protein [Rhizoctonia solani 123E]|uniref:Tyrosine kinase catalytic domain protein n=1 Tax=Rhizoctonia solani 123E TaxID=1423351 RepID=A0A074RJY1_9AGAM|nr:tyrosine kinase catalytic domain protein [Rhizoctonia solani 123E]